MRERPNASDGIDPDAHVVLAEAVAVVLAVAQDEIDTVRPRVEREDAQYWQRPSFNPTTGGASLSLRGGPWQLAQ